MNERYRAIDPNLSIYLDLMRFCAALAVFLGHISANFELELGRLADHPSEAVAVFFVLSGLLIAYATDNDRVTPRRYASARLSRLYSVVIVAIPVCLGIDWLGYQLRPELYQSRAFFSADFSLTSVLQYFAFTNELWFNHIVVGTNEPYWSLGFEAWYYLFFALAWFLTGAPRVVALSFWFLLVGPKIALYLPLWLFGVVAYRLLRSGDLAQRVPAAAPWVLLVASAVGYLVLKYVIFRGAVGIFHFDDPTSIARSFIYFHLIGIVTVASILAVRWIRLPDFSRTMPASIIRYFAGITFTLYLCHQPLMHLLLAIVPSIAGSPLAAALAAAVIIVAVMVLAELGERRKTLYRNLFDSMLGLRKALPKAGQTADRT